MRWVSLCVLLFSVALSMAAESYRYSGTLAEGRSGPVLVLNDGRALNLGGLEPQFLRRHRGERIVVYGSFGQPVGADSAPILYPEEIVVTAPAARVAPAPRVDSYTPPHTAGERAADALKQLAPLIF